MTAPRAVVRAGPRSPPAAARAPDRDGALRRRLLLHHRDAALRVPDARARSRLLRAARLEPRRRAWSLCELAGDARLGRSPLAHRVPVRAVLLAPPGPRNP